MKYIAIVVVSLGLLGSQARGNVFIVTTTADSGAGSLRQAILDANGTVGSHTINFNISGSGVQTITPLTALPAIGRQVVIDGYSQPGSSANTLAVGNNAVLLVELNGHGVIGNALVLGSSSNFSTVSGLIVNRFTSSAILVQGSGNVTIAGNWMGVDSSGTVLQANSNDIFISGSLNNLIGGTSPAARNVLQGTPQNGSVTIHSLGGATIQGNYVGTTADGTAGLGAGGITVGTSGNLIGGTAAGAGNVISGDRSLSIGAGIGVAKNNVVQGNTFGLNAAGTAALSNNSGNGVLITINGTNLADGNVIGGTANGARNVFATTGSGVVITGALANVAGNTIQGNYFGLNVAGTAAPTGFVAGSSSRGVLLSDSNGNLVGGTAVGAGNVIANYATGVEINGAANVVQGNLIGTNAAGTAALGNVTGVLLTSNNLTAVNNIIGGAAVGARNVIAGNTSDGIRISIVSGSNVIQGNLIGLAADGVTALGNGGDGVRIQDGSKNNTIGGIFAGDKNVIAFNGGAGVFVFSTTAGQSTGNAILGNSIYSNGGLGIDLGLLGVTPNDLGDADSGANFLQNYPLLTLATSNTLSTHIEGSIDSLIANSAYSLRLEFFDSLLGDPSGFGEGRDFLGFLSVAANGMFTADFPFPSTFITATATDANGNTSEFSQVFLVQQVDPPQPPTNAVPEPTSIAIWSLLALVLGSIGCCRLGGSRRGQ